ncbi:MAG: endonuclease/exonuclease/phosphatase family protein [Patescibacteria group bacterium]
MPLSVVTLNIEGDKHLERAISFLKERKPDIVCIQEIHDADLHIFEEVLGANGVFAAGILRHHPTREGVAEGEAIFSRLPILASAVRQYAGEPDSPVFFDNRTTATKHATQRYMFTTVEVEHEGERYRFGTTHFIWTPDGEADELQRRGMAGLLKAVGGAGEMVLMGDFNAPRGKEMFALLAAHFKDNVPPAYMTSIDGSLHRKGPIPLMVDGIFSTPEYRVLDVSMLCGVSDHCALVAKVTKP